jgi:hypothetical protein
MKRILTIAGFALATLLAPPPARAASAVTGAVNYDAATKLYTYTYTVDASALSSQGYVEFAIRENLQANWSGPMPSRWTQPDGFGFVILAGGAPPPLSISGSYWSWISTEANATFVGNLVFSFSTTRGVSTDAANNFFLFTGGGTSGPPGYEGFVDFGHIVGPSLVDIPAPTFVPEPGTGLLWSVGLLPVLWAVGRRRIS